MPFPSDIDAPVTADTVSMPSGVERRPPLRRGSIVGRYVVIDRAGEGGMGVVYKAYDPELERAVALKLLHSGPRVGDEAERRRARLLREARALARLSHPNVIAVHDVGTFHGDVFLATEFVEGAPLKSWVMVAKPSAAEIVRVMTQAGEGLAAAHRAGLVHRDFKPGNLLVGKDGRARVLDFGLARALEDGAEAADAGAVTGANADVGASEGASKDAGAREGEGAGTGATPRTGPREALTHFGQVLGTPRYMAPEQHLGSDVDARSDQFSFCVTLYEALYGEPPFEAGTDDYRSSATEGRLRPAPPDARVPRRLRQILVRGLAVRPEDRWPSMDALLAALRRDPASTRRWAMLAGAVVVTGAAIAAVGLGARRHAAPACPASDGKLAGVWDAARKKEVSAALTASGAPGAAATYARVEHALDAYASQWLAMRTDACLATRVRAEQSEELLDLRMECLDDRLDELRAQVDVLAHADAATVGRAVQAASSLAPLDGCADAAALRAPIRPPADAATRARVKAVRARLAEGRARQRVGDYGDAHAIAASATDDATKLAYPPLQAEALFLLGDVQDDQGDYKSSEQTMVRAATAAITGHHDEMLARSLTALIAEVGLRQARFGEAHAWASLAEAAAGRGDAFVRGEMHRNLGRLLYREGKFADARAQTEACLTVWRPALGDDALAIAGPLTDLGNAYYAEGDYAGAARTYEQSIAVLEKSVGPDSPLLGPNLNNLGDVASHLGQYDRAEAAIQRALDVWQTALGPDHPKVALARYNLAEVWRRRGQPQRALPEYRRSLAIDEKALGPDNPETAYPVEGIADALRATGDIKGALAEYERALAIREKALGPTHPEVAETLTGIGEARLAAGQTREAMAPLERALSIQKSQPGDPAELAETQGALDRAHAATGR